MITDQQFIDYIQKPGDSYERIKDLVYMSSLDITDSDTQEILGDLSDFRDIACIALRESHVSKTFRDN